MSLLRSSTPQASFIVHQLENGLRVHDQIVQEKFAWANAVVDEYSGWDHHYFTCLESPDKLVQIGGWDSLEDHYVDFHGSPMMRELLYEFGDVLDIKASWHSNIAYRSLSLHAPYLALARVWVPKALKSDFEDGLRQWIPSLASRCSSKISYGWRLAGGWVDQEMENDVGQYVSRPMVKADCDLEDTEEWNILLPFDNREDWKLDLRLLGKTDSLSRALQHVTKLQVKHLQMVNFAF